MNTDPNIDDFPRLVPPQVVYEHKDSLKKKATVIPLFAKVTSAAAVVALLIGLFWWRSATPEQPLMAEMRPIAATAIESQGPTLLRESQAHFVVTTQHGNGNKKVEERVIERDEMQMIPGITAVDALQLTGYEISTEILSYRDDAMAYDNTLGDQLEDEDSMSEVREGFFSAVHVIKTQLVASIQQINSYTIQPFTLSLRKIRDYDFEFHPMER